MGDCVICCDEVKHLVTCPYCKFEACDKCVKTYIFDNAREARCMNSECFKEWSKTFLIASFSKYFVQHAYKKHVDKLIIDFETGLLKDTAIIALIRKLNRDASRIRYHQLDYSYFSNEEDRNEFIRLSLENHERKLEELDLRTQVWKLELSTKPASKTSKKEEEKPVIIQCPSSTCNGYLVNWKCSVCETYVCHRCRVVRNEEKHECKDEDLETVRFIKSDTKPCPNCHTAISKDGGCNVMWCTDCKTGFYWTTLKIIHDHEQIHNPHFFEDRNRGGRDRQIDLTNEFDECTPRDAIIVRLQDFDSCRQCSFVGLYEYIQRTQDIHRAQDNRSARAFAIIVQPRENLCMESRVAFINGDMTKDEFERSVTAAHKKRFKMIDFYNVIQSYCMMCQSVLLRFINENKHIVLCKRQTNDQAVYNANVAQIREAYKDVVKHCYKLYKDALKNLKDIADEYANQPYRLPWYQCPHGAHHS